jgi:hypothetical protein
VPSDPLISASEYDAFAIKCFCPASCVIYNSSKLYLSATCRAHCPVRHYSLENCNTTLLTFSYYIRRVGSSLKIALYPELSCLPAILPKLCVLETYQQGSGSPRLHRRYIPLAQFKREPDRRQLPEREGSSTQDTEKSHACLGNSKNGYPGRIPLAK